MHLQIVRSLLCKSVGNLLVAVCSMAGLCTLWQRCASGATAAGRVCHVHALRAVAAHVRAAAAAGIALRLHRPAAVPGAWCVIPGTDLGCIHVPTRNLGCAYATMKSTRPAGQRECFRCPDDPDLMMCVFVSACSCPTSVRASAASRPPHLQHPAQPPPPLPLHPRAPARNRCCT